MTPMLYAWTKALEGESTIDTSSEKDGGGIVVMGNVELYTAHA